MRYSLSICLAFFLILACSRTPGREEDSFDGDFLNAAVIDTTRSAESYAVEASNILDRHRLKLKGVLRSMMTDQIKIYKNALVQIDNAPATTSCFTDTQLVVLRVQANTSLSLLDNEVALNKYYFNLLTELSTLNLKYADLKRNGDFNDYFDVNPIILSDEVLIKVAELHRDEIARAIMEKNRTRDKNISSVLTVASNLPGATKSKAILTSVARAAKAFRAARPLTQNANLATRISYKMMNKSMSDFIAITLKNEVRREKIANRSVASQIILKNSGENLPDVSAKFHQMHGNTVGVIIDAIGSKLEVNSNHFADGLLASHFNEIRNVIKLNNERLK